MRYLRPKSIPELQEILMKENGNDYSILAGGTDLMPRYRTGLQLPEIAIDIKILPGYCGISEENGSIEIGALVTIEDIRKNHLIQKDLPCLSQACHEFAGTQIRNRATIGGNICNASPAGDLLPGLYLYSAELQLISAFGSRKLPIEDFILGPGKTALKPGEILVSIHLKNQFDNSRFYKLGLRQSMAISVINYAMGWSVVEKSISKLAIMAGSVAPTIVSLDGCCKSFLAMENDESIAENIAKDIFPIDDIRATAKYRQQVLKNLILHDLRKFPG
ncbi:MAG: xanthine dehydrogenase family protein subunit M [Candidatus Marinimicrobia bacterium]|nr:xanthine dehydrogenase family protein subunit M [Candidatus Neomarinimicrobiota bacterium]MBT3633746.1 xanthine dehydrogenase family protein subunit M [Candidatus Neomarinimicrobiota bacterium]MBT3682538.1 xanthine dehydrogenase family protein subunit M [Candidatus Neomarinimicrobiota bacterium]MBT3759302.1 xanthine dehydrogenase family protein subunit M [Candidatus Neomarinimicrobiota bacterium]MBT3894690.1 xanthine dehydrogenase family protein subunit M [Candidatus Neomarinimicrobiota bact